MKNRTQNIVLGYDSQPGKQIVQLSSSFGSGGGGVTDHNSLTGIQGGLPGEYNHLTNAQLSAVGHNQQHAITSTADHTSTATAGKMLKADANGLPVNATNTDTEVSTAVTNTHVAATVAAAPLTISGQQITFNYDTNDFQLNGNNLQVKDGGIDHGGLGGLLDDDHTQYALLVGRSTGQRFIGGTAASEELILDSTSNATKGKLILSSSIIFPIDAVSQTAHITAKNSHLILSSTLGSKTTISGTLAILGSGGTSNRLVIDHGANTGIGMYISGTLKWSMAGYLPTGTNHSFTIYNDQTSTVSLFLNGDTNNLGIRTNSPNAPLHVAGTGTTGDNMIASFFSPSAADNSNHYICVGRSNSNYQGINLGYHYDTDGATSSYGWINAWGDTAGNCINIKNGGNVGIGIAPGTEKIYIYNDTNATANVRNHNQNAGSSTYSAFQLTNSTVTNAALSLCGPGVSAYAGANSLMMYQLGNYPLGFVVNNVLQATINTTGLGVKTAPSYPLHVAGAGTSGDNQIAGFYSPSAADNSNHFINIGKAALNDQGLAVGHHYDTTATDSYGWLTNYGEAVGAGINIKDGSCVSIGLVPDASYTLKLVGSAAGKPVGTTWTETSDLRLKDNVETADYNICYNNVKSLDLKRWAWKQEFDSYKKEKDQHRLGFIAQEAEVLFPKAITESKFETIEDCKALDVDQINKTHYGATKKLIELVETQQTLINDLLKRIEVLEKR